MNGCVDKDFLKILFSTWLSEKIQSGEVQAGLHDCDGKPIGQWSKVMLCCPGCGDSGGGGGGGGVDKFLRDVVIDKEKGAMTFKVYGGSDVVVTISDFLSDMDGYVNGAVVDNDTKTITLKVKDQDDVVINLAEMLQGLGGGADTYHTVKQPTFNNDTRVLTIPQERFLNGASQGVDNWEITIPATGNAPGGTDNDTKVAKVEFIETNDNSRKVKVKVTDSAGATFETADLELDASGGIDTNTKIQSFVATQEAPVQNGDLFKAVKLKVTDTDGQEHEATVDVPKFVGFGSHHETQVGNGLRHVLMRLYYREDSNQQSDTIQDGPYLPVAKLKSASLSGDQLYITLNHTLSGVEIPSSEQRVSVDLGSIKFKPTPGQDTPESTSGTALPTTIFGARDALLGKPAAFTEVVGSDGQTYLMPLYAKP